MGPLLGALVMLADLAANWWIQWDAVLADPVAYLRPAGLSAITAFGVFVIVTALPLYRVLLPRRGMTASDPGARA
ncbi:hypothetical protein [Streptomyces caniferus]|uniref:hypothetical protein n=1 Tax=Streptomyces caniferus TaxID=285557 RepID=UPI0038209A17